MQGEIFLKEIDSKRQKLLAANNVHQENIKTLNDILNESKKTGRAISTTGRKATTETTHIENKLTESQKLLTSIKNHSAKTTKYSDEINELLSSSQSQLKIIEDSKNSILNSETDINKIKEDAISTNEKINKLYGFANNSAMAGAFGDRRDILEIELSKWHTKVIIGTAILFVSVILLLGIQMHLNNWTLKGLSYDFYLRFLFVGPIFYYIVFCNTQYNHTRRVLDKYTFKATVALTIEAHTELLSKNFTEEEFKKDILNFSLDSLNKVYDRPYIDEIQMAKIKEATKTKANGLTAESLRKELSSKDSGVYKLLSSISSSLTDKK